MKRRPSIAALFLGLVLPCLAACSQRDKVVNVEPDDAEMNAAIATARDTLPEFWEVFDKPAHGESDFALKVRITDKNGAEHFWATDIIRRDGTMTGIINNDPNIVASVKLGDKIEIAEADISDWLYMRDGKMVGNHTLKPLFKSMTPEEVAKLKSMMADP